MQLNMAVMLAVLNVSLVHSSAYIAGLGSNAVAAVLGSSAQLGGPENWVLGPDLRSILI